MKKPKLSHSRLKLKKKEEPTRLRGLLKQTEGSTPKKAISKGREAGALKRRERRLSGYMV